MGKDQGKRLRQMRADDYASRVRLNWPRSVGRAGTDRQKTTPERFDVVEPKKIEEWDAEVHDLPSKPQNGVQRKNSGEGVEDLEWWA